MKQLKMARWGWAGQVVGGAGVLLVGLALLALAVGQGAQAIAAPGGGASGSTPAIAPPERSAGPARLTKLTFSTSKGGPNTKIFSGSTDNMIYMQMIWTQITGRHDAHVTLTSPDGQIYQVLNVPFIAGPEINRDTMEQRPGVLHPARVQAAQWIQGTVIVWSTMPIAGTWMGRMPGTWNVLVRLDADPQVLIGQPFALLR